MNEFPCVWTLPPPLFKITRPPCNPPPPRETLTWPKKHRKCQAPKAEENFSFGCTRNGGREDPCNPPPSLGDRHLVTVPPPPIQETSHAEWGAGGLQGVDGKNSQTTPATTSTSSIRQLLGATDAQTAHPATSSTAPAHQPLSSANAETTPAGAPAAAADRKQQPDATCEGKNG